MTALTSKDALMLHFLLRAMLTSRSSRRPTAPKAWSGPNPITQRAAVPTQPNASLKNTSSPKAVSAKEKELSDKHSYDRVRYLFGGTIVR